MAITEFLTREPAVGHLLATTPLTATLNSNLEAMASHVPQDTADNHTLEDMVKATAQLIIFISLRDNFKDHGDYNPFVKY